jgi:mannitol operon repressor
MSLSAPHGPSMGLRCGNPFGRLYPVMATSRAEFQKNTPSNQRIKIMRQKEVQVRRSVSVLLTTAEDLAKFVEELRRESDRGLPLVATALIDQLLRDSLRALSCENGSVSKLLDEPNAPLGTFSSRIEACFALGLIDQFEYSQIHVLRKVRNEFAHARHGMDFKASKVQGLCSSLKADLPLGADYPVDDPRFRFTNATVVMVLRLYHRPDWVALERRQPKAWVSEDATRWRSFKDEPPPPGIAPIMVMGRARVSDRKVASVVEASDRDDVSSTPLSHDSKASPKSPKSPG